jgi:hypothetical protein
MFTAVFLAIIPYVIVRGVTNRIARHRVQPRQGIAS